MGSAVRRRPAWTVPPAGPVPRAGPAPGLTAGLGQWAALGTGPGAPARAAAAAARTDPSRAVPAAGPVPRASTAAAGAVPGAAGPWVRSGSVRADAAVEPAAWCSAAPLRTAAAGCCATEAP
ncbi:hypothetical protein ACFPRL_12660 [Pseudoclavibacter helvolus]